MPSRTRVVAGPRLDLAWLLVVLLTVFALAPLAYPGFFEAGSGFLPVFNTEHISEAPLWGRTGDSIRTEGKLAYLLSWPLLRLTGSGVAAVRAGYALAFLLGALGVYLWTRPWVGAKGAVLAAVVYTYLPWHLATVYVRGAYAEAWLWTLWPFALWSIDRLGEWRLLLAGAVAIPVLLALLWVQPGLALLSLPLLVAYGVLVPNRSPWPAVQLIAAMGLPALLLWYAGRRIPPARIVFGDHYLHPFQLLSASWGTGASFQLGLAALGLGLVALTLWLTRDRDTADQDEVQPSTVSARSGVSGRALWFWAAALLILGLLSLPIAAPFWEVTGYQAFLTYPWQVLALTGLPLAFLAGSTIRLDNRLARTPMWAGLVALVLLASYPYLAPEFTQVDPGPEPDALFQPVEAGTPQIVLLEHKIAASTEISPSLTLTLTWQAVEPVRGDYTVFVHALAPDGSKAAQRDTRPCQGACPTNTWQPGDIILDQYELELNPNASAGPDRVAIGLYLLASGDRALVAGQDDRTVYLDVPNQ
ncbi:MAG: hypothetical protein PVH11_00560 [Anaerolineae bacterium]